ncbi:MAG: TadE/TadG family type IV pilus assembly protein [Vicinamibacterales bacterium]
MKRTRGERGTALVEAALTIPILLLISVGIFEFGRAYQTWQILTNAAREGARIAVLPNAAQSAVEARVREYMQGGQLPKYSEASVTLNRNATLTINGQPVTASLVTVDYPFNFIVLKPVARLIAPATSLGSPLTMRATALMRNEAQ